MTTAGRRFANGRKVRLGDVDPKGRLRLDALARYLQDVANDDSVDAGRPPTEPWVVRKVSVDAGGGGNVDRRGGGWPRLHDWVELTTWCSGVGPRWAERTTTLSGPHGVVTAVALWVYVDARTLLPARLPEQFHEVWAEAAGGRKVRGRLEHEDPPGGGVEWRPWPLRAVDHDVLDHMNNAVYWEPVEEVFGTRPPDRAEIEYRVPVTPGQAVSLGMAEGGRLWLCGEDGTVHASVVVTWAGGPPGSG
ncbi:MAG TPA: acyl-ACP thioesterase domain-containing protein [Acidimicrobiales bacterium]|nr:acyl-ACP thioesterase domain-containing protein [Acidimicrobiales bacterium]